jgi:hypothetical protein
MISASSPIDSAQPCTMALSSPSLAEVCEEAVLPGAAPGAVTRAHSVMRPRVTSCSMSTTSTANPARVSNRPAVMPGRSLPKIFTRRVGVSAYEGGVAGDVVMVCPTVSLRGTDDLPGAPGPGEALRRAQAHRYSGLRAESRVAVSAPFPGPCAAVSGLSQLTWGCDMGRLPVRGPGLK